MQNLSREAAALVAIRNMLGNVNHATRSGPNDALYRGNLLNDIREICNETLADKPKPKAVLVAA